MPTTQLGGLPRPEFMHKISNIKLLFIRKTFKSYHRALGNRIPKICAVKGESSSGKSTLGGRMATNNGMKTWYQRL